MDDTTSIFKNIDSKKKVLSSFLNEYSWGLQGTIVSPLTKSLMSMGIWYYQKAMYSTAKLEQEQTAEISTKD